MASKPQIKSKKIDEITPKLVKKEEVKKVEVKKDEVKVKKEEIKKDEVKKEEIDEPVKEDDKIKKNFDAYEFYKNYDPSKNVFNNVLSLYEYTSCLGLRATQISEGCPVLIDVPEGIESPEEIAIMEMKAGKCPLIICREGREYWRVCDLINPHLDN
jgi:DNA-directed RNA polymerase subunit K/omega